MKKNNAFWIAIFVVWLNVILITCHGQITLDGKSITMQADTMTVKQAFRLLNYMVPANQKINKIVIKDGKEWYQTRYLINRMMKRRAYTEVNGKVKLVRI